MALEGFFGECRYFIGQLNKGNVINNVPSAGGNRYDIATLDIFPDHVGGDDPEAHVFPDGPDDGLMAPEDSSTGNPVSGVAGMPIPAVETCLNMAKALFWVGLSMLTAWLVSQL